jgi:RNA polymerase sigma-32 factor
MAETLSTERSVDRYVTEINKYRLLSREVEQELARRYRRTGDFEAAHQLVVANLRFVVKIAHEYRGYGLKLLDLVQEGNIGLMMAVKKFEPEKGYRLISYAVWWIRAYIQNFIMRSWSLVKLGTTQAQRKLFFKLRSERERADRAAGPGAVASTESLAKTLDVREHEVSDMESRMAARDFSLDMELQEGGRQTHLELLSNPEEGGDQESEFEILERRHLVRGRVHEAMEYLNEKERYIVENRLMTDEPKTLQEIGKHFRISRVRARQIEGNVIRKFRSAFMGSGLEPSAA